VAFNLIRAQLAAGDRSAIRTANENSARFQSDAGWQASVGKLLLESGRSHEAVPFCEHAFQLQRDTEARHLLASAYIGSRQPARALTLISAAHTAEDHFLRGSALLVAHKLTEAASEADAALAEKPREPRYMLLSARIQQMAGHQDEALELLRQTEARAPDWAEPYFSTAVSYYFEHRYEDSRNALNESLKRNPDSPRSLFLFAVTLINQGNNAEARKYLQRAIAIEPDNARFWLHLGTTRLDDPAAAQQDFLKAVSLKPDYALPHYELGKLLAHSHSQAALEELEKAISCEPGLAQAYYQLSRVASALGDKEKSAHALAVFNRLKKQEEGDERVLSEDVNGALER
jgi:tetratricopeptide (TPR) repeat protein